MKRTQHTTCKEDIAEGIWEAMTVCSGKNDPNRKTNSRWLNLGEKEQASWTPWAFQEKSRPPNQSCRLKQRKDSFPQ